MKKHLALLLLIISLFFGSTVSAEGHLPIVAVAGSRGYSYITPETAKLLGEAGFNVVQSTINVEHKVRRPQGDSTVRENPWTNFDLTLENVNRHGMQMLMRLWDPRPKSVDEFEPSNPKWKGWYALWANLVGRYGKDPRVFGWQLSDEPSASRFAIMRAVKDTIIAHDPLHHPIIVNQIPYVPHIKPYLGGLERPVIKNYSQFIEYFAETFKPGVWSYDSYAVGRIDDRIFRRSDLYRNLDFFSRLSRKEQKPFWAYVLAMEVNHPKTASHPHLTGYATPDRVSMGLEARSALAFGAQGLVYWSVTQRGDALNPDGSIAETYPNAGIDLDGQPTPILDAIRELNADIRSVEDIFVGCEVKETAFTKDPSVPKVKLGLKILKAGKGIGPIRKLIISKEGDGLLLSRIENNGRKFIVAVNFDIRRAARARFTFLRPMRETHSGESGYDTTVSIAPGDWVIFEEI